MNPLKLLEILSVPGTDNAPVLKVAETAAGVPLNGWLEDADGNIVARLESFRFNFVNFKDLHQAERIAFPSVPNEVVRHKSAFVHPFTSRIKWVGPVIVIGDYLKGFDGSGNGELLVFKSSAPKVEVCLHAHGWSGKANIEVDGRKIIEANLFNRETSVQRRFEILNPQAKEIEIIVRPLGIKSKDAFGSQVLLEGFYEFSDEVEIPTYVKHPSRNRGGQFDNRFFEILSALPMDAVVLDVGGGRRQIDDARYLNLEYSPYEEPDILGDGTRLPFRSSSIDFVYTAAVLEHVENPLQMGREIYRVLKPGGKVLANSAFMQPVHSEGQHFFNLTPYGIELVFNEFDDKKIWWYNDLNFVVDWFIELARLRGKVADQKIDDFLSLAADLSAHVEYDRAMYFASGVWLEGTKPSGTSVS